MSKEDESSKMLNIENDTQPHTRNNQISRKNKLISSMEETLSFDEVYILSISGTQSEPEFRIAAALSDYSCVIYYVGEFLSRMITLNRDKTIVGIKFSPTSSDTLYVGTEDGLITVHDLRANGKSVAEFKDDTEDGQMKCLASFDVNCDERFVAGGTQQTSGDAFVLFWDIRKSTSKLGDENSLLGAYWESHIGDITCLAFHPIKQAVLASGSTDGLMNVFDIKQSSEDLALTYSLNTESSVDRIGWLTDDSLWCTTHTNTLQLWDCEGASAYASFKRDQFIVSQNDEPDDCYIVRCHPTNTFRQPFVLAGSSTAEGETLRCLNVVDNRLETLYEMEGNKQIVRDSWIHENSGCLVTVGESGIINVWRQAESTSTK